MTELNTEPERTRLTVEARRDEVKRLSAEGLSQRQIAKRVGVTATQVNRDLNGRKPDGNGGNVTSNDVTPPSEKESAADKPKPKRHRASERIKQLVKRCQALLQERDDALDERDDAIAQRDQVVVLNNQLIEKIYQLQGGRS